MCIRDRDKGVDILASAGTLGFGSPKICVQIKSTDAPVDRIVLDQLGGVMKNFGAEYGLLVSWSGFKSSVISETAKQFFEIRLWTHKEIIEEFLKYYDQIDEDVYKRQYLPNTAAFKWSTPSRSTVRMVRSLPFLLTSKYWYTLSNSANSSSSSSPSAITFPTPGLAPPLPPMVSIHPLACLLYTSRCV